MALIRFVAPVENLEITGVPVTFSGYVTDIDESQTEQLSRIRYLGPPLGVIELGAVTTLYPWPTIDQLSDLLSDSSSGLSSSVRAGLGLTDVAGLSEVSDALTSLRLDVDSLKTAPTGGGVRTGTTVPVDLQPGVLFARSRTA